MRPNITVGAVLTLSLALPVISSASGTTREFRDPGQFAAATRDRLSIGFDGILPPGTLFLSFSLLSVCGVQFSTPNPGTVVDVVTRGYYSPNSYPGAFIVDSDNPSTVNHLDISLTQPARAVALEYGGLGFSGVGVGKITLSNGHEFTMVLPTVGHTQFIGFVSTEPITSLTFTATNDHWVVTRVTIADRSPGTTVGRREQSKNTIHFLYVLPCDGVDEQLDTNGTIATSVRAFQRWLEQQTNGQWLQVDRLGPALDITFLRLGRSDPDLARFGVFLRDELEREIHASGFDAPDRIYAAYYAGHSAVACGGAPWPPTLVGNVAAVYLLGEPPGAPPCNTNPFATSPLQPGYWEFAMLHEIVHALGFVATCAPNQTLSGHVSDDPRDLMYAGPLPWQPSILDVNRDDYFRHGNAGCPDLRNSSFLTPPRP